MWGIFFIFLLHVVIVVISLWTVVVLKVNLSKHSNCHTQNKVIAHFQVKSEETDILVVRVKGLIQVVPIVSQGYIS